MATGQAPTCLVGWGLQLVGRVQAVPKMRGGTPLSFSGIRTLCPFGRAPLPKAVLSTATQAHGIPGFCPVRNRAAPLPKGASEPTGGLFPSRLFPPFPPVPKGQYTSYLRNSTLLGCRRVSVEFTSEPTGGFFPPFPLFPPFFLFFNVRNAPGPHTGTVNEHNRSLWYRGRTSRGREDRVPYC